MLSPSDTALVFLLALLLFGPEQLPRIARQLGEAMRHMQSTTHSFMNEMERAARIDDTERREIAAERSESTVDPSEAATEMHETAADPSDADGVGDRRASVPENPEKEAPPDARAPSDRAG